MSTIQIPGSNSSITNPGNSATVSRPWFTFFENLASTVNTITISSEVISVFGRGGIVEADSGDYTASQITNVPTSPLTSTNVQDAIDELAANIGGTVISVFGRTGTVVGVSGDYTASKITNVPSGNITATNVQSAIDQLDAAVGTLDITNITGDDYTYYPVFVSSSGSDITAYINDTNISITNGSSIPILTLGNLQLSATQLINNTGALTLTTGTGNAVQVANTYLAIESGNPIRLYNSSNSNYTAIEAQSSLATTYTLTLPSSAGSSGNVLSTDGSGNLSWTSALSTTLTSADILVGNSLNIATAVTMSGDATLDNTGILTLSNTTVTAGTYGDDTNVPQFTVDSKGRITSVSNISINVLPSGTLGQIVGYDAGGNAVAATLTGTTNQIDIAVSGSGTSQTITFSTPQDIATTSDVTFNSLALSQNTGLQLTDISGSYLLTIKPNSTFTANRTLSLTTGDANRSLTLTADATISGINSGDVTLSGQNYLSLTNQVLAASQINLASNVTGILPIANGGTGLVTSPSAGQILIGQGTSYALETISGDATINSTGALTLAASGVTAGTYGDSTSVAQLIVDSKGRITSVTNITISGAPPTGSAGGDLSGTYPDPTVAKINGVTLGDTTATSGNFLIGSGSDWVSNAISGDATISNLGVLTITNGAVNLSKMANLAANSIIGNNTTLSATPLALSASEVKTLLNLNNVENIALSTWNGSTNLTTLGTILTGIWNGTAISEIYGGTNQTSYTLGDILYASAANTLSKLTGNTSSTNKYLSQTGTGTISAAPVWSVISGADVTGAALTSVNDTNITLTLGGSPTTALLNATSLTLGWTGLLGLSRGGTNANLSTTGGTSQVLKQTTSGGAITVGQLSFSDISGIAATTQGGTGLSSYVLGDILYASAANTLSKLTGNTSSTKYILSQTGTGTISAAPVWIDPTTNLTVFQADNIYIESGLGVNVNTPILWMTPTGGLGTYNGVYGSNNFSYNDSTQTLTVSNISGNITSATNIYGGILGSIPYQSAANTTTLLAGNTSSTKKYLSQTGTGSISAAPAWSQIAASDLSNGTTGTGSVVLAASPTLTGSTTLNVGAANGLAISLTGANYGLQINNTSANNTFFRLLNNSNNYYDIINNTSNQYIINYNGTQYFRIGSGGSALLGNSTSASDLSLGVNNSMGTGSTGYVNTIYTGSYNGGEIGLRSNGSISTANGIPANSTGIYCTDKNFTFAIGTTGSYNTAYTINNTNRTFAFGAGIQYNTTSVSANYTALITDYYIAVNTTAARTITLPSASTVGNGFTLYIYDSTGSAATNNITINRAGSDTINGTTSKTINTAYGLIYLISNGSSNWNAFRPSIA